MTGKEILEEEFDRATLRGGYSAEQVDAFLQKVASYVDQLNEEKEDMAYKLKVLADKIEEYKSDEENIREALLGAQKLGSSILNEAKAKAETLTADAQNSADEMLTQARSKVDSLTKESLQRANVELASIKRSCDLEQRRLDHLRKEVGAFKATVLQQYKAQLKLLSNLPSDEDVAPAPAAVSVEPAEEKPIEEPVVEEVRDEAPAEEVVLVQEEEPEEAAPARSATISTSSVEISMEEEERGQTKEFTNPDPEPAREEPEEEEQEEQASFFMPSRPSRPNYMEKFGELKFGDYSDKDR